MRSTPSNDTALTLEVRRTIARPPERVFAAFTEADQLQRWLHPSDEVRMEVRALDFREGGGFRFHFTAADGAENEVAGVYRTIDPPNKLVFTWTWEKPEPMAGRETLVTFEFLPVEEGTEVAITHERFPNDEIRKSHDKGWSGALENLNEACCRFADMPKHEERLMKSKEAIRFALGMSEWITEMSVKGLEKAPLQSPTENGGPHPLWVMGHLALVEGGFRHVAFDQPNPVADWQDLFGRGTQPSDDASNYPPFDEVVERWRQLRAENLELLDATDPADFDNPCVNVPEGLEAIFASVGKGFMALALHTMAHRGHLACARRALGLMGVVN
jgi:uncharacterized protein YndB with AHSA1/START domain